MFKNTLYKYDDVFGWAERTVSEVGEEFKYTMPDDTSVCAYVHYEYDDLGLRVLVPGCIIGRMLVKNTIVTLEELEAKRNWSSSGINTIAPSLAVDFTEQALDFMAQLQSEQDRFQRWSYALDTAKLRTDEKCYDRDENRIPWDVRAMRVDVNY